MNDPEPWTKEARDARIARDVEAYIVERWEARQPLDELHLVELGLTLDRAEQLAATHREELDRKSYRERMAPHFAARDGQRLRNMPWWNRQRASSARLHGWIVERL